MGAGDRHERIATSALPSRSRHKSFGCYEMCACTVQALIETAWPTNFRRAGAYGSIEFRVPHISAPVCDAGIHREVRSPTIHGLLLRTNNQLRPLHCLHCGSPLYPKASQDGHPQTQKPGVIPVERGGQATCVLMHRVDMYAHLCIY
jgi:hypothetical protein